MSKKLKTSFKLKNLVTLKLVKGEVPQKTVTHYTSFFSCISHLFFIKYNEVQGTLLLTSLVELVIKPIYNNKAE